MSLGPFRSLLAVIALVVASVAVPHKSAQAQPAQELDDLLALVPAETRGVAVVDVASLMDEDAEAFEELVLGVSGDVAFRDFFTGSPDLWESVDLSSTSLVVIAHPIDPADGLLLLAQETDDIVIVGDEAVGGDSFADSAIAAFTDALTEDPISFVYGLPALYDDEVTADLALTSAEVMSGSLQLADGAIEGSVVFHTEVAQDIVAVYNSLNRPLTDGEEALEEPLVVEDAIVDDHERVVVALPSQPLVDEVEPQQRLAMQHFLRRLFVGLDAYAYAEDVADREELAWLDFVVLSERDDVTPVSPGSVYIRWEFRDEEAIREFEENELPEGFRLAPTQFLESDDPDGEIFFALNLYNAGGGSIVGGARAEWDVFVHGPDGADPNAGERPRFMVVEALAEEVTADSVNLLTVPEPLSHALVGGDVVSTVSRFEDGVAEQVFETTFPVPDPDEAPVARFTREMAIGNDYIYWGYGVSDRVLYNATTFNHDAHFVDIDELTFTDDSHWAQYLSPDVKDAVYYQNTLEYVASPMENLDSEFLDIEEDWLDRLVEFTTNGHQDGLMKGAVEQLFIGTGDPFVGEFLTNDVPAAFYHFVVSDPEGLADELALGDGEELAPISLHVDGDPEHYLTLSIYRIDGAVEGVRAEWNVYVDNGLGRPPRMTIVHAMTEDIAVAPGVGVALPSVVEHEVDDETVTTRLSSTAVQFDASFSLDEVETAPLSMDWIEAGDIVCHRGGGCDLHYYDAETLDVAVQLPQEVEISEIETPWDAFIDGEPAEVFFRANAQQYAVKPWYDIDVEIEPLPFAGVDDATHTIAGEGSLEGRATDVVDSTYVYTGDARVDDDRLVFAIDQEITNPLGVANIYTSGEFDLGSGAGRQTVVDCVGPALMCSGIEIGSTEFYRAGALDADDLDEIAWEVVVPVVLGGSFGTADSSSNFVAVSNEPSLS